MTDDQTARLHGLVGRERRSLLQYVRAAEPYAGPADRDAADRLRQMAAVEAEALDELLRRLARLRVPPAPAGTFPAAYTGYNYAALAKLLPRLAEDQARLAAEAESDVAMLGELPADLRAAVEGLVARKRRHGELLAALAPSRNGK